MIPSAHASLFLAICYLKPRRSLVAAITFLSILGPILGVAVLIIVIAVMAGFSHDIRDRILGMQAHIRLSHPTGVIEDPAPALAALRELGVQAAPLVEGPVLIQTERQVLAKFVRGVLPESERLVSDIHRHVRPESGYEIGEGQVLVGEDLAWQVGAMVGEPLLIHSPERLNRMVTFNADGSVEARQNAEVYMPEEVRVAGVFSMGMYDYDANVVIMHLEQADDLFGLPWGAATSLQVRTADPFDLEPVLAKIRSDPRLEDLDAVTWTEANRRLFGALRVEKNLMFFLLIFIVVVAAFGIAGTLITVVIDKTREIGVLKALGASPLTILMVFVLQGAIVGAIGTGLGTLKGLLVLRYRNELAGLMAKVFQTEIFPKDLYHLSRIPALVNVGDVLTIDALAFLICVMAALVPATYAAMLTPTEALRNDGPG